MKKKKTALSLYASKAQRKRKRKGSLKKIGRPWILHYPRSTKDLDSTIEYEEEESVSGDSYCINSEDEPLSQSSTDAGSVSSFHTQHASPGERLQKGNMAGQSPSLSPSSSSSSSTPPLSSSSDSDSDDDIWGRPYIRHFCRELRNVDFVRKLVQKLYTSCCLQDFMLLVTQIANGQLSPLNIAFLLCLECVKWQSLKSTTQMKYRDITKTFWLVVYQLLKGKGLRFFSGPKNYGQVVSKDTTWGKYDPKKSEINFAVPDERYLRCQDKILGQIIPPGMIEDLFKIVQHHQDVVLMADCKWLAKGLKSVRMGDVDLWGHEKPPTLEEKVEKYQTECGHLRNSIQYIPHWPIINCHDDMKFVMQLITTKICDVREIENVECKWLLNYEKCHPDPNFKV